MIAFAFILQQLYAPLCDTQWVSDVMRNDAGKFIELFFLTPELAFTLDPISNIPCEADNSRWFALGEDSVDHIKQPTTADSGC